MVRHHHHWGSQQRSFLNRQPLQGHQLVAEYYHSGTKHCQPLEPHWETIIISKPPLSSLHSSSAAHREISKHGPGAWDPLLGDGFHPQGAPSYQPTCLTSNSSRPLPNVWSSAISHPTVCHKKSNDFSSQSFLKSGWLVSSSLYLTITHQSSRLPWICTST